MTQVAQDISAQKVIRKLNIPIDLTKRGKHNMFGVNVTELAPKSNKSYRLSELSDTDEDFKQKEIERPIKKFKHMLNRKLGGSGRF